MFIYIYLISLGCVVIGILGHIGVMMYVSRFEPDDPKDAFMVSLVAIPLAGFGILGIITGVVLRYFGYIG